MGPSLPRPAVRSSLHTAPMTQGDTSDALAAAARHVLAADGRDYLLRDWQVAWLVAVSEGREGVVPVACGAGAGWLDARMREALAAHDDGTRSTGLPVG